MKANGETRSLSACPLRARPAAAALRAQRGAHPESPRRPALSPRRLGHQPERSDPIPYIHPDRRARLDPHIAALRGELEAMGATEGDVNYAVTSIVAVALPEDASYADYNAAMGVLFCAALELYRTETGPYEDAAKVRNGPVRWIRARVRRD